MPATNTVSYYDTSGALLSYEEWREKHNQQPSPLAFARWCAYEDSWHSKNEHITRAPESRSKAIPGSASEHTDPRDESTEDGKGEQEQLI